MFKALTGKNGGFELHKVNKQYFVFLQRVEIQIKYIIYSISVAATDNNGNFMQFLSYGNYAYIAALVSNI